MTSPETLQGALLRLERTLLEPEVRRDAERLKALLSEDFIEIGRSGRIFDRDAMIASLTGAPCASAAPDLTEFTVRQLADGLALATYFVAQSATRRSSLWRREAQGWRLCFHQGTPAAPV